MISEQQKRTWARWLVHRTRYSPRPVIRLGIQNQLDGSVRVTAMVAQAHFVGGRYLVGLLDFDSESVAQDPAWPGLFVVSPLNVQVTTGTASAVEAPTWLRFFSTHAMYHEGWMTKADNLCVFREFGENQPWSSIPIGGLLGLRYLSQLEGMVRQARGTTKSRVKADFLTGVRSDLEDLIDDKFDEVASLTAGMN